MRLIRLLAVLVLPALVLLGSQAFRSEAYNRITNIPDPGGLVSNDIFWADSILGKAFLADRTNAGVDVYNTRNDTFIGRIPTGGVGTSTAPNGVATDAFNQLVFIGQGANGAGDSFTVASATSLRPIATIVIPKPGGGAATGRADELAVAPGPRLVVVANDQDVPPFMTEISYTPDGVPTIVGQIPLPTQTGCGIEQTVWVPELNQFWTALPTAGGCPGGIAVFSATPFGLVRTIPTDCSPAGMIHGPARLMFVGCTPAPEVVTIPGGVKVATLGNQPSSDEVWYDPGANAYEFLIGAPTNTLNIYSAATNGLIETDSVGSPFHNLTADAGNMEVFVATGAGNPNCLPGCAVVFAPPSGPGIAPLATLTSPFTVGVTCNGAFFPNATQCGSNTGVPTTSTVGVTCNGVFFPNGSICGFTGP